MNATGLTAGIHSISEDDYQNDPCSRPSLSASIAKILISSTPLHAWHAHPKLNPNFVREEKEIFDRGQIAHALLLQGLEKGVVLDYDDWRKTAARAERDMLRQAGKIPILSKHWEAVKTMVEAARHQLSRHKEARNAFTNGKAEVSIVWEDEASDGTKVLCRGRLDWLHDDYRFIDDYKSTGRDVNPEGIARVMLDDWDVQAEFYRRGVEKVTGIRPAFRFVAQENTEPYALAVIGIDPMFEWLGQKKVQAAIDTWAKCITTNEWPGYTDHVAYPVLPEWAEKQWLAREMAE